MRQTYFHILLALYEEPRHGLGIADEVEVNSSGALCLGPGTLYRSLKEMTEQDLIEAVPAPKTADPRRKFYSITGRGRERLEHEARRFAHVVDVARRLQVLPERGSS